MSPLAISAIVFACIFGGALLGMWLRTVLPEHHLSAESKDIVKVGMGVVGTMAALVLGLLVASAKSSYDTQQSELLQMSANVVFLDRVLAHYGPETKEAREMLRGAVVRNLTLIWGENNSQSVPPPAGGAEGLYDKIQALAPQTDAQRAMQGQAFSVLSNLAQMRWLMYEQAGSSISVPFLVVVVFWLTIIFVSYGLFAPPNATVIATLLLCALSVAGAILLIEELNRPFQGLIQISSAPLRNALAHLGQ